MSIFCLEHTLLWLAMLLPHRWGFLHMYQEKGGSGRMELAHVVSLFDVCFFVLME